MPSLKKNTIAQTFKFNCDRFLRFSLASKEERERLGLTGDIVDYRPGIALVIRAGSLWEIEKYEDLIAVSPTDSIAFLREDTEDEKLGKRRFKKIEDLFDRLRQPLPPSAIIEGEFIAPASISPGLKEAYVKHHLEPAPARPDILWIRKYPTGAPLIGGRKDSLEYELHVIDVKMAAEPSLRHFIEVTYYALALHEAIKKPGLSHRYAVSSRGLVWPGSHDVHEFRNLHRKHVAEGTPDPVMATLLETLISVPYEVYQVHVKQFFEDRLLRVLDQAPEDAAWHVSPKSQLCDFVAYCQRQAEDTDHLSRIAWLTHGQAKLLRENGITTTRELAQAIEHNSPGWRAALSTSHQLRAESAVLYARAEALQISRPVLAKDRVSALMPAWSDMNIYLTIHFDMGTGISFAFGAKRVYFQPGRAVGDPPKVDDATFIVDRVDELSTDSEKKRFLEFIEVVSRWLDEASRHNSTASKPDKVSAHIFFWDDLEIRQLGRMLRRHISDPAFAEQVALLLRFFPPDNMLPDPSIFKSQPMTVVKEVFRTLIGLPIALDYTLFEVANSFYPSLKADGTPYKYGVPYGFEYPMTDQIPSERAYELWHDRVLLKRSKDRFYTRGEIYKGIEDAVQARLEALNNVVKKLRDNHKDRLTLVKAPFSAAEPVQTRIPEKARQLVAFTQLNAVVDEIKNRHDRSLPIEEREARFISVRGIMTVADDRYADAITEIRTHQPRYATRRLIPLTFSPDSRDCRFKEGDFLLALSNETPALDLDVTWYHHLGISFEDAQEYLTNSGLGERTEQRLLRAKTSALLQMELVKFESFATPPFMVLAPADAAVFEFAQSMGLIDVARPMVLDPIYRDFKSDRIKQALVLIGGDPPKMMKRRKS